MDWIVPMLLLLTAFIAVCGLWYLLYLAWRDSP